MRYAYEAIAQFGGRDAGYIGTWRTKEEARTEARKGCTQLSFVVRRVALTPEQYESHFGRKS